MKTKDFSYFIERYISGDMTESEKQWFIKEIEGNEELEREVKIRKKAEDILKRQSVISLRLKLTELERNRMETTKRHSNIKMSILRYAAVFAGAAVITSLVLFTGKSLTSEEIVSRFYKTYEAPAAQRSVSVESNMDYVLGLKYYNAHDYRNAASQFAKVLENNPDDMQTHLLSGVSNMEEKKYNEAKKSFTIVIDDDNNLFIESARWYLALCYVKTEEIDKASQLLTSIKNEKGIYSRDAKKVLRKLK